MKQIITVFACILFTSVAVMAQSNQAPASTAVAVERVQPEVVVDQTQTPAKPACCASQTATAGCADKSSTAAETVEAPVAATAAPAAEAKKPGCGSAATSAGSGCCSSRGAMRAGGNTPR